MGILGNLFGMSEDNDIGARIALASQALMAMDQGQVANIGPSIAVLNERRRKVMDEAKSQKWLQNQAAAMADKNPRLAAMLQDPNTPPEVGQGLIAQYIKTLPEFQLPDWKTFDDGTGNVMRYDANNPNSKPELFFDGPQDPFKALIEGALGVTSGAPPRPSTPAASAATPPGATSGETAPMPAATGSEDLNPQLKILAQSFGLPENATKEDIMSVAQAGLISKEQAAKTAENIIKRYEGLKSDPQKRIAFSNYFENAPEVTSFNTLASTLGSLAGAVNDDSQISDLDFVYGVAKALDPQSVVRESEGQMVIDSQGITPSLLGRIQAIIGKGALLPEKRRELYALVARRAGEYRKQAETRRAQTLQIGKGTIADEDLRQLPAIPDIPAIVSSSNDKGNQPFELDPSKMIEGKIYEDADMPGTEYKLQDGAVMINDGTGWRKI